MSCAMVLNVVVINLNMMTIAIFVKENSHVQNVVVKNINTMIHYPIPPHLQLAYKSLGFKAGDFPIAENIAKNGLSLPMGSHLSTQDIEYVCDQIIKFFKIN